MPVDAIGSVVGPKDTNETARNSINQSQFIKLFLTQLRFQDPMEPVDNREFLAQLAQFTSLEQQRQTSENTTDLLSMNANSQAVSLLNRQVDVSSAGGSFSSGTVTAVRFNTEGALLTVRFADGSFNTTVRLSQISLVKP